MVTFVFTCKIGLPWLRKENWRYPHIDNHQTSHKSPKLSECPLNSSLTRWKLIGTLATNSPNQRNSHNRAAAATLSSAPSAVCPGRPTSPPFRRPAERRILVQWLLRSCAFINPGWMLSRGEEREAARIVNAGCSLRDIFFSFLPHPTQDIFILYR